MAACRWNAGFAPFTALLGVTLAVVGVCLAAPQWATAARQGTWNIPAAVEEYRETHIQSLELNEYADRQTRCREAADATVDQLIADRIDLSETVMELRELGHRRPDFDRLLVSIYPSFPTVEERIAQYALVKVRSRLCDDPSRLAEVMARLQTQYRTLYGTPIQH